MSQHRNIAEFLRGLDKHGYRLLELQMCMAKEARIMICDFGLSKEKFCELAGIPESEYDNHIWGSYEFSTSWILFQFCIKPQQTQQVLSIQ